MKITIKNIIFNLINVFIYVLFCHFVWFKGDILLGLIFSILFIVVFNLFLSSKKIRITYIFLITTATIIIYLSIKGIRLDMNFVSLITFHGLILAYLYLLLHLKKNYIIKPLKVLIAIFLFSVCVLPVMIEKNSYINCQKMLNAPIKSIESINKIGLISSSQKETIKKNMRNFWLTSTNKYLYDNMYYMNPNKQKIIDYFFKNRESTDLPLCRYIVFKTDFYTQFFIGKLLFSILLFVIGFILLYVLSYPFIKISHFLFKLFKGSDEDYEDYDISKFKKMLELDIMQSGNLDKPEIKRLNIVQKQKLSPLEELINITEKLGEKWNKAKSILRFLKSGKANDDDIKKLRNIVGQAIKKTKTEMEKKSFTEKMNLINSNKYKS